MDDLVIPAIDRLADCAFVTVDPDHVILSWNLGAERLLDRRPAQVIGKPLPHVLAASAAERAVWIQDLQHAERHGMVSGPRIVTASAGSTRPLHATVLAVRRDAVLIGYAMMAHPLSAPSGAAEAAPRLAGPGSAFEELRRELLETRALLAAEIADRTQSEMARAGLLRRLVTAQEDERRRLARELHDGLGQEVTSLRLTLESLGARTRSSLAQQALGRAFATLARLDHALDFMAWELRPAALDDLGIASALDTYVHEWSRHSGIAAEFDTRLRTGERFPSDVEANVYRIAQEALNNVAKHAAARSVAVTLDLSGDLLTLVVRDDGRGCHPTDAGDMAMGMDGMRERAAAVGGTLDIASTSGGGTTVTARLPAAGPVARGPRSADLHLLQERVPGHAAAAAGAHESGPALTAMQERIQELQHAVAARDDFIATVAHELRNPVAPLVFQVRLALNKLGHFVATGTAIAPEWIRSQFQGVEHRLHRLLETLDRLLDVSRLSTGRIDLKPEPMNLADMVQDVIDAVEAELAVARCTVTLSVHGDVTGTWDRLRVEQICRNLLSNAIRFGAGRPIDITIDGRGDVAHLAVRDHGIGIPADQQSRIFERFERGVEQQSGGFGIGLWLVRNICAAMGGSVSVTSEPGDGACFLVVLPRHSEQTADDASLE